MLPAPQSLLQAPRACLHPLAGLVLKGLAIAVLFAAQPFRKIDFRFGYYDGSPEHTNHLIIMHKP